MVLTITDFIGRLHPLLVHLPIGILLMGLLLQWMAQKKKYNVSPQVLKVVVFTGMCFAFLSCITGYVLSLSDDYDEELVGWHFWMGISVAVASMFLFMKVARQEFDMIYKGISIALLLVLTITGHLGASLTHGRDYLFGAGAENADTVALQPKFIPDIAEATVYGDVIQPVFQKQCYGCHGPKKQKGKFRIDSPASIMKGGKDGEVIVPFKSAESEMIKRIKLPLEDEHHMPPKEKPQLKDKQIALLQWWVDRGADFTKKVKELEQPENIHTILLTLQNNKPAEKKEMVIMPEQPVEKASEKDITALRNTGAIVIPVAQNTNYLSVNFINAGKTGDKDLILLKPLQKQLVSLKLGNTAITDSGLILISKCPALTFLQLSNTSITDKGLKYLTALHNLRFLVLTGTKVSTDGVLQLDSLKLLKSLYLYQTKVNRNDWKKLEQAFPKTLLDSGGYAVPYFNSDTTVLKFKRS